MIDSTKNFAKVTVSIGYDDSATSIDVSTGEGVRLPSVPFNATWWNSTDYADPSDDPNVEIVRVTAISTDTLTVTRAQEGTSASTKNTGGKTYKLIAGLTAKTINTDLIAALGLICNGRLTLETGVPISLTDQTAKTSIFFTPFKGNRIALFDGTSWNFYTFTELTLALGTLTADKNYDVFIYNNAGTLTLELSAAWTDGTTRADALTLQDGVYVKSGATTRRYLGTLRTTSTTTTEDSLVKRFLWNAHNRVVREMDYNVTASHSYNGDFRQWNNDTAHQLALVVGLAEGAIWARIAGENVIPDGKNGGIAVGLDSSTVAYRGLTTYLSPAAAEITSTQSTANLIAPQLGYHELRALESSFSAGAVQFVVLHLMAGIEQ